MNFPIMKHCKQFFIFIYHDIMVHQENITTLVLRVKSKY